jgi:hypothetical protein
VAGVLLHEWLSVVRRARLGRTVKAVALMLSTYANVDGTKVYPGIARLAVECELSAKAVKGALAALREQGLIEVVRAARKAGEHNEYRLILAEDILERIDVPPPDRHAASISVVAEQIRGRYIPQGTARPADDDEPEKLRGTAVPADDPPEPDPAGNGEDDETAPAGNGATNLRGTPLPPTTHGPRQSSTTHSTTAGVRTDAEMSARCPAHPPMPAGERADGWPECTFCRHALRGQTWASPGPARFRILKGGAA